MVKRLPLSFRAILVLTRYNGFRGSICVTDMVELIHGIPSGRVFMRETRFTRVSLLRRLLEAKPDECLSNISHAKQTYVKRIDSKLVSNLLLIPFDLLMGT